MKYELMTKGVQILTEVIDKKPAAEAINEFYNSPAMKATGYILGSVVVVAVIVILAVVGYKAWAKKQGEKFNNNNHY